MARSAARTLHQFMHIHVTAERQTVEVERGKSWERGISWCPDAKGGGAEAKYLQGQGIARQRQAIVNGLRESVLTFSRDVQDISSRDVIELMMMTQ